MKKLLSIFVLVMLLGTGVAYAQDAEEAMEADAAEEVMEEAMEEESSRDAGVLPGSFLYFFDRLFEGIGSAFTFGAEAKAERQLMLAEERLAEAEALAEEGEEDGVERAEEGLRDAMEEAIALSKESRNEDLELRAMEAQEKNSMRMQMVHEKLPHGHGHEHDDEHDDDHKHEDGDGKKMEEKRPPAGGLTPPPPPSGNAPSGSVPPRPGAEAEESTNSESELAELANPDVEVVPEETRIIELQTDNVAITTDGEYRYIVSNGIPNHETGEFPNKGNPNTITEQDLSFKVPLEPVYTGAATPVQVPGVGLNGIPLEPGTAERNGEYNIEAIQEVFNLGLDNSNAHVQPNGLYHYHGVPEGYLDTVPTDEDFVHVAWAADGFPMYVSHSGQYESSWKLRSGARGGDVGGAFDGTYTQDFQYVENLGDLDECNGMFLEGNYVYVLTDEFPYIPRCLNGTPDASFSKGPGAGTPEGDGAAPDGPPQGGPEGGAPPQAAIDACISKALNSSCYFTAPNGVVNGTCMSIGSDLACAPAGGPPQMP